MLKKWNYQGKGLGAHEQGNLEPIQDKKHPKSCGIGHTSEEGTSSRNVGTAKAKFKHPSKPTITSSKAYNAIPPPPSLQPRTTYHIPPSSS
ncbi:hypothetical protein, partial [[Clostridium] innocuum]|uniref:hypothetical protein n=1 Tax=Clostridium innocuum TaxID=1522 RepID=UPI002FF7F248